MHRGTAQRSNTARTHATDAHRLHSHVPWRSAVHTCDGSCPMLRPALPRLQRGRPPSDLWPTGHALPQQCLELPASRQSRPLVSNNTGGRARRPDHAPRLTPRPPGEGSGWRDPADAFFILHLPKLRRCSDGAGSTWSRAGYNFGDALSDAGEPENTKRAPRGISLRARKSGT